MKFTWKKLLKIFTVVIVIGLLSIGYLTFDRFISGQHHKSAYKQIQIGDSKERVIELFGKPDEIVECRQYRDPPDCANIYDYSGLFEGWYLLINTNDTVIGKEHSALGKIPKD